VVHSETVDNSRSPASVTSGLLRDPPFAHFEIKDVSTFLHFPVSNLSQGNPDLKHTTARQIIPKASVQLTASARICQISGFQRKTEVMKLYKILSKSTNTSGLPSKNWPNSLISVQGWGLPSSGFSACANTCLVTLINITCNNNRPCLTIA
jgi:hypothetical protein